MKVVSAPTDNIDVLQPYVNKVLEVLGHPDAFATDESIVWDFLDFTFNAEEKKAELSRISNELGFDVTSRDHIYKLAERLKSNRSS